MQKYLFAVVLLLSANLFAQDVMEKPTPLPGMRGVPSNIPDISVIGNFYGKVSEDKTDTERNRLTTKEVELALQGYIYPEMKESVVIAAHKHGEDVVFEICEGYVSFLKVIDNLSCSVGKIHVDFGKINKVHQHHRSYVDQPQVITNFFGDHGLVGEGANLSYLMPLPFFFQIDISAWRIPAHSHEAEESSVANLTDAEGNTIDKILVPGECENEFGLADEVYTTRYWFSFPSTEKSEIEFGLSGAKGRGSHYEHHKDKAEVFGADLTYKLWLTSYERIIFQNELLYLMREVPVGTLKRYGWYSFLNYRFNKYWDWGFRYD
ncbi:MAG: hypothetical protein HY919_02330 [Elusimicrobia bacterium]|nr:hypothetical protein [Elusimicrobiota bacterium]